MSALRILWVQDAGRGAQEMLYLHQPDHQGNSARELPRFEAPPGPKNALLLH